MSKRTFDFKAKMNRLSKRRMKQVSAIMAASIISMAPYSVKFDGMQNVLNPTFCTAAGDGGKC